MKSATIAASFVAGAVTMLLLSRRNRYKNSRWADGMSEELKTRIGETKDITREKYEQIIEEIRPRYEKMKDVSSQEVGELIEELKSHWKNISKEAKNQIDQTGDQKQKKTPLASK